MWSEDFIDIDTESLKDAVIPKQENLLRGWSTIFINEYNQEQDRFILLTEQAYYRVKFNQKESKVSRHQRIALIDVTCIQKGVLKHEDGNSNLNQYGFRIFNKEPTDDINTVSIVYRTFRPHNSTKEMVDHITRNIAEATKKEHAANPTNVFISSASGELVEETDYITLDPTPIFSKAHNALGLGRSFKKSAKLNPDNTGSRASLFHSGPILLPSQKNQSGPTRFPISSSVSPPSNVIDPLSAMLETEDQSDNNSSSGSLPSLDSLQPSSMKKVSSVGSDLKNGNSDIKRVPSVDQDMKRVPSVDQDMKRIPSVGQDLKSSGSAESSKKAPAQSTEVATTNNTTASTPSVLPSEEQPQKGEDLGGLQNHPIVEQVNYMARLFSEMDHLGHLLFVIVVAFFVGYLNFSFLWILGILYLVYKIDAVRQHKLFKAQKREKKREEIVQAAASKWAKSKPSASENCNWFNIMISELWPYMSSSIAETSKAKLKELLEYSLNQKKPTAVETVTVSEINFGSIPPTIKQLSAVKPPFPDYRVDFDISYNGPAQIILDVHLGGKFVNVRVPIAINEFDIRGRMRVEMTFCPKSPFLHTLTYAFIHNPSITLSIKPLKAIDIMEIPFLKESIEESLRYLVSTTLVLPEQIVIPYFMWYAKDPQSLSNVSEADTTRQENIHRHSMEVEKSKKEGEFAGLLHIRILEARKLLVDRMGSNSNPYCIVTTGPHEVFTTSAVKRGKTTTWNEFFELLVKKQKEKKVEVTVMARDTVNGDDFLGMAIIDFTDFGKETRDIWAKLESTSKKGSSIVAGEIHLQIRYVRVEDEKPSVPL